MKSNDYQKWSKAELIKGIEWLKKRKKYGLVWEDKPEDVVEICKDKLPIVKEIKGKAIVTDKNKPVNLLIEGDNYHSLSVLNYTHAKKIDVIYIDPPYNTGNKDFIFNDRYIDKEDGYRHSKWLSFMEKRLKLAKNLLKDTGAIFISIDDNEASQLKLMMDLIFGEYNKIGIITWQQFHTIKNDAKNFSKNTEFILVYSKKDPSRGLIKNEPYDKKESYPYNDQDGKGPYKLDPIYAKSGTASGIYTYKFKDGREWMPPKGTYPRYAKKKLKELEEKNEIVWKKGKKNPMAKRYLEKVREGKKVSTLWTGSEVGYTMTGDKILKDIIGKEFQNPKPPQLIKRILNIAGNKNSVVLDFMAGTGTTAHAVLDLNKEDGGNRQFILCTNNENNICTDVCYPRIKKVIEGYSNLKERKVEGLGGNLKYFKTAFVDAEPTDKNKIKLTQQATEMLCIKERTFESILSQKHFKIFKNNNHYTGIIFDQLAIPEFKKAIKDIKGKFSIYVFSLSDETFDEEFADIKQKIKLSPIPEAILRVYRRIFR